MTDFTLNFLNFVQKKLDEFGNVHPVNDGNEFLKADDHLSGRFKIRCSKLEIALCFVQFGLKSHLLLSDQICTFLSSIVIINMVCTLNEYIPNVVP